LTAIVRVAAVIARFVNAVLLAKDRTGGPRSVNSAAAGAVSIW